MINSAPFQTYSHGDIDRGYRYSVWLTTGWYNKVFRAALQQIGASLDPPSKWDLISRVSAVADVPTWVAHKVINDMLDSSGFRLNERALIVRRH